MSFVHQFNVDFLKKIYNYSALGRTYWQVISSIAQTCKLQTCQNPAYRRHWISCCVRIVEPIPNWTETERMERRRKNVTWHMSPVIFHVSPVTCHLSLMPTATATDFPPATPPLCTIGWFAKTPKKLFKLKKNHQIFKTTKMSRGVPQLTLRSLPRSLQSA